MDEQQPQQRRGWKFNGNVCVYFLWIVRQDGMKLEYGEKKFSSKEIIYEEQNRSMCKSFLVRI